MKKIATILTLMMVVSVFAFAVEKNQQIFFGFEYRKENFDSAMFNNIKDQGFGNSIKDIYKDTGAITFGFATMRYFDNDLFGLYNSLGFVIPYYTTMDNVLHGQGQNGEDLNIKNEFGNIQFYGFGLDWIIGPSFIPRIWKILKFPISIGGHIYGDFDFKTSSTPIIKSTMGLGGLVGVEIHIWKINLFVQCQLAYDFWGFTYNKAAKEDNGNAFSHGKANVFSVMPQVGIGLKL